MDGLGFFAAACEASQRERERERVGGVRWWRWWYLCVLVCRIWVVVPRRVAVCLQQVAAETRWVVYYMHNKLHQVTIVELGREGGRWGLCANKFAALV